MRLAIVIPGFQSGPDDWCIPAFTNLARELARSVEVEVFALRYPHQRRSYRIGKVTVHALGAGAFRGRRFLGLSLISLWRDTLRQIKDIHNGRPFDAVLGIWATESGWLATKAAAMLGVPSEVHLAGGELVNVPSIKYGTPPNSLPNALVRSTLRNAHILTAPSSPTMKALSKLELRPQTKVRNWPLGVDTAMFSASPHRTGGHPFTFICAASLIPVKGHDLLLKSFALLARQYSTVDVRLQLAGTGPLERPLRQMVTKLGLEGYVEFLGEVPHFELPALYQSGDCFVLASWHEAQCMAVLEAMACGLTWVGSAVGALADLPSHGHATPTGIRLERRDAHSFASAMRDIVELSPGERCRWGQNGRAVIERDYELERQTDKLLAILREL